MPLEIFTDNLLIDLKDPMFLVSKSYSYKSQNIKEELMSHQWQ